MKRALYLIGEILSLPALCVAILALAMVFEAVFGIPEMQQVVGR